MMIATSWAAIARKARSYTWTRARGIFSNGSQAFLPWKMS